MYITAFFTASGVPQTALSPTITIWDVDGQSGLLGETAMQNVGGGFYRYGFNNYDNKKNYGFRCDGGSNLPAQERYTYGVNDFVSMEEIQDKIADSDASIG